MSRLKEARKAAGMTQAQVAEYVGMTQNGYSYWERGAVKIDSESLKKLADLYGVSIDYLMDKNASPTLPGRGFKVPVLGTVVAGIPIEAVEDVLDYEEITPELAASGEFFALQVKGASMEPRIRAGDVVIVRCQPDADTGDTVVVLVNGDEATIKRLKKGEKGITLLPNNPAYEPLYYENEEIQSLPVTILGKVIELRAKF